MKPWKPYWKGLEKALESIHRDEAFKIDPCIPLSKWVQDLKFLQLVVANDESKRLASWLIKENKEDDYFTVFDGEDIRFQLYLRCLRALDFCRGRVENRKEFDWEREPKEVYKILLIDDWMSGALHWISKCHPTEVDETKNILQSLLIHPEAIHRN